MPKDGWTNLTMRTRDYDKVRRLFDTEVKTNLPWSDWLMETLMSSLEKRKALASKFPHLRFMGNTENGCVIEDTKAKKIVTLTFQGTKLVSSDKDEQYIIFGMLYPELRIR